MFGITTGERFWWFFQRQVKLHMNTCEESKRGDGTMKTSKHPQAHWFPGFSWNSSTIAKGSLGMIMNLHVCVCHDLYVIICCVLEIDQFALD